MGDRQSPERDSAKRDDAAGMERRRSEKAHHSDLTASLHCA
jgi:hypothetical protein